MRIIAAERKLKMKNLELEMYRQLISKKEFFFDLILKRLSRESLVYCVLWL